MSVGDDKVEFEALARPHLDALYRTALRMVRHPAAAEDMVQETCLRAFASFGRSSRKTNFRAWLFRILVNLCIDHIRAAGRESALPVDAVPLDVGPAMDSPDPEQHAISRSLRDQLRRAIEALAPELRVVVLLVLVEEMSYAEAAESLEVPVGTVRSRLNRARAHLQSLLNEQPTEARGLPRVGANARAAMQ
jgi:RNA polymerase sigma-70 factor (ECF subfamily)